MGETTGARSAASVVVAAALVRIVSTCALPAQPRCLKVLSRTVGWR
jgi:hypothetical protein